MINNYHTDEQFLARWIAGELSVEELNAFKNTKVYKQYLIINNEAQLLEAPKINTEAALIKIKQQLNHKQKPKVRKLWLWYNVSIAAMFILGIGFFLTSSKTYTTGIGETKVITLADGSIININANSSVSHKRFFWSNNDGVSLNGEALFKINKSDGFTVQTSKGIVSVLGTQFNIRDRKTFNVKCYEGKVQFTDASKINSHTLTKGMGISILDNNKIHQEVFEEEIPAWKKGTTTFNNKSLAAVLTELTIYYNVNFDTTNIKVDRLFTGAFKHDDLNLALQATLIPMGIDYELLNDNKTIVLKK